MPRLGTDTLWGRFHRRTRRTFRRVKRHADADLPLDGCADGIAEGIAVVIVVIVVVLVFFFVVVPLLVAVVDVLILVVLALGALVARVVLRRPWLIEARDGSNRVLRWRIVGWRASAQRVKDIRHLLAEGSVPPDAEIFADPTLTDD